MCVRAARSTRTLLLAEMHWVCCLQQERGGPPLSIDAVLLLSGEEEKEMVDWRSFSKKQKWYTHVHVRCAKSDDQLSTFQRDRVLK